MAPTVQSVCLAYPFFNSGLYIPCADLSCTVAFQSLCVFLGGLNPQLQRATTSIQNRDGIKRANNKQTNRNDVSNNTGHGPWLVSGAAEPVVGAAHTMLHIFAYGPKTGPAFLRCDIFLGGGVGGV